MKNKNNNNSFKLSITIAVIMLLSSAVAVYSILKLNSLPTMYLMSVLIVFAIFNLLYLYLLLNKKQKGRRTSQVLSILLSLALITGSYYASITNTAAGNITGGDTDTHVISVLVLKDNKANKVNDIKDVDLGVNMNIDSEYINETINDINTKLKHTFTTQEYMSNSELVSALYSGKESVILISEGQRPLIEEEFETFSEDTRIIHQLGYEVKVDLSNENSGKEKPNVNSDTYTIFISGFDTYGPVSAVSRSDVNMLMTVNPKENQVLLTSIPRDYHVVLGTKGKKDKLTHAGIYGVGESVKTLENLFKIDIDFYVKVNFSSLTKIVDSLGGISVNSEYNFSAGGTSFKVGNNTMNGTQALNFVRERYTLPGGDNARIKNQQAVLTGIINKAMSPAIIKNYPSFLSAIDGVFIMSMGEGDFKSIIREQLRTMSPWDILDIQVTGTGATSSSTFSMPGRALYVMEPNMQTVNRATQLIEQMETGQRITK